MVTASAARASAPRGADEDTRDIGARRARVRATARGLVGAPSVVLLHDLFSDGRSWDALVPALEGRYRVLIPDLPGFGESEKPTTAHYPYSVEAFAESIADVIAAFRAAPATVVGHGLGAAVAITLASDHPELVRRLVLVGARCYPRRPRAHERALGLPLLGSLAMKSFQAFDSVAHRESAHATWLALRDLRSVAARLGRIHRPSLIVWGREDRVVPMADAQRLARDLTGARLSILEAGHAPHEEQPAAFAQLLATFIDERR
jgi:pimeloyl-ACP methyl ester carboxylesterase